MHVVKSVIILSFLKECECFHPVFHKKIHEQTALISVTVEGQQWCEYRYTCKLPTHIGINYDFPSALLTVYMVWQLRMGRQLRYIL